jgi:hypothetical protein
MSLAGSLAHMGTTRKELATSLSPDEGSDRQLVIDTCMAALRESNEPAVRREAYDLLIKLGVLTE